MASFDDDFLASTQAAGVPVGAPASVDTSTAPPEASQQPQQGQPNQPQPQQPTGSQNGSQAPSYRLPDSDSGNWTSVVVDRASAKGVPPGLVVNLVNHESSGNPTAQNPNSSAYGLGQQTDGNWADYVKRNNLKGVDRHDPYNQADATADNLKDLHSRLGSWYVSSMAYYAGEGLVNKAMRGDTLSAKEQQRMAEARNYANAIGAANFDAGHDNGTSNAPQQPGQPQTQPQTPAAQPQSGTSSFDADYQNSSQAGMDRLAQTAQDLQYDTFNINRPDYDINPNVVIPQNRQVITDPALLQQQKMDNRPMFVNPLEDTSSVGSTLKSLAQPLLEGGRAGITALYDTAAGIQNVGNSADAYVKGLFGANDTYIPTPMLEERTDAVSQALTPRSRSGQTVADILPFVVSEGATGAARTIPAVNRAYETLGPIAKEFLSSVVPSFSGAHSGEEYATNLGLNTGIGVGARAGGNVVQGALNKYTRLPEQFAKLQQGLDALSKETQDAKAAHMEALDALKTSRGTDFEASYRAEQTYQKYQQAAQAHDEALAALNRSTNSSNASRQAMEEARAYAGDREVHPEASIADQMPAFSDEEAAATQGMYSPGLSDAENARYNELYVKQQTRPLTEGESQEFSDLTDRSLASEPSNIDYGPFESTYTRPEDTLAQTASRQAGTAEGEAAARELESRRVSTQQSAEEAKAFHQKALRDTLEKHWEAQAALEKADKHLIEANSAGERAEAARAHLIATHDHFQSVNGILRAREAGVGFTHQQLQDARNSVARFIRSNNPFQVNPGDSRFIRGLKHTANAMSGTRYGVKEIQKVLGDNNVLFRPTQQGGFGMKMSELEKATVVLDSPQMRRYTGWLRHALNHTASGAAPVGVGAALEGVRGLAGIASIYRIFKDPKVFKANLDAHLRGEFDKAAAHLARGNASEALRILEEPYWGPDVQPIVDDIKTLIKVHKNGTAKNYYKELAKNIAIALGTETAVHYGLNEVGATPQQQTMAAMASLVLGIAYHRGANRQLRALEKTLNAGYVMKPRHATAIKVRNAIRPVTSNAGTIARSYTTAKRKSDKRELDKKIKRINNEPVQRVAEPKRRKTTQSK